MSINPLSSGSETDDAVSNDNQDHNTSNQVINNDITQQIDRDLNIMRQLGTYHYREATEFWVDNQRRDTNIKLWVREDDSYKYFNIQNTQDAKSIHWYFHDCDLSNFTFFGNAYRRSSFSNTNLTNADLSSIVATQINFGQGTILHGTKFPINILEPEVMDSEESTQLVIKQFRRTYIENGGRFSLNRFTLFGITRQTAGNTLLQTLKDKADANPRGASATTLRIHGLM